MATPLINGINYDWGNVTVILFGVPVVGITKISYKSAQVKENNYGLGRKPVSRGYGPVTFEGSIEMYADEWKRIISRAPFSDPLQIPAFDIAITFGGNGTQPCADTLRMVEFLENPLAANQGDTKLLVTIPLIIGDIEHEGI